MKLFFSFSRFASRGLKKEFPFFCTGIEAMVLVLLGPEAAPSAEEMTSWVEKWVDYLEKKGFWGPY